MERSGFSTLPVVDAGVYKGVVNYDSLAGGGEHVGDAVAALKPVTASMALSLVLERLSQDIPLLPVVDELSTDYVGSIDRKDAISVLTRLFPPLDEFTELTISCRAGQYSASAIAHAVEDADAHLLNLNVVGGTYANSDTTIVIRVNHSRGESVARSLLRYGYETIEMRGNEGVPDREMAEKVKELLHYIEV